MAAKLISKWPIKRISFFVWCTACNIRVFCPSVNVIKRSFYNIATKPLWLMNIVGLCKIASSYYLRFQSALKYFVSVYFSKLTMWLSCIDGYFTFVSRLFHWYTAPTYIEPYGIVFIVCARYVCTLPLIAHPTERFWAIQRINLSYFNVCNDLQFVSIRSALNLRVTVKQWMYN